MNVAAQIKEHAAKLEQHASADPELCRIVLQELERVQASRFFKNSHRSRQFLEYIVTRKLEGHAEELKERTIGAELFQRPANYATGDDPVVRVQAGEVRRRLEQFYQAETDTPAVRIELAVGSYAPQFHLPATDPVEKPIATQTAMPQGVVTAVSTPQRKLIAVAAALLCIVVVLAAIFYGLSVRNRAHQATIAEQFWGPALASQQPVLICLAKPVVYRPTLGLYRKYSKDHPESFTTEVERSNRVLPLDPKTPLVWSEMAPYSDYGAAAGDVEAAVSMSALLGQLGKPTQVRIGDHYSFEDLRNSPSAVIGAFNNKWTMQITSGLHFRFVEDNGTYSIHEETAGGRSWLPKIGKSGVEQDFAIVARLLDSNTGQFTIVAAGILGNGTQAAGEFVSKPALLERALRTIPNGWQNKNLEFVVQTDITDTVAGPPSVVAYYSW